MTQSPDLPAYLKNVGAPDDAEYWRRMRARFDQLADTVRCARIQTHGEAAGAQDKPGKWRTTGPSYDAGFLPYVGGIDQAELLDRIGHAAELADALERLFAVGELSAEFAYQWGLFCELAGSLELLTISDTSDMHSDRAQLGKGAAQRKWVALQLIELIRGGCTRTEAEAVLVRRIRDVVRGPETDPRFPHSWYAQMVTPEGALNPAYTSAGGRLTEARLASVARGPFEVPALPT